MTKEAEVFEGWAVVELMGHRKLAGYVREQNVAGAGMLRLELAKTYRPEPVTRYELPALPAARDAEYVPSDIDDDGEHNDYSND